MSDAERIERMEKVLATLIWWPARELGENAALPLLARLEDEPK